jgi:hypothetical protein
MNFDFNKKSLNKREEKSKINFNNMSNNRETKESLKRKVDELLSENEKLKNQIEDHKKQKTYDLKPKFNYIIPQSNDKNNDNQKDNNMNQKKNESENDSQERQNRLVIRIRKHIHKEEECEDGEKNNDDKKNNKKRNKKEEKKEEAPIQDDFDPFINDHLGMPPILVTLIGLKRQNTEGGDGGDNEGEEKKKKKEESFFDYFKNAKELHPITKEIKTLQDFIDLGKSYDENDEKRYVINLRSLHKCVPVLEELSNMIGMKSVKKMILDLLFYRLQNLENEDDVEEKPALKKQRVHNLPSFMMPPPPPDGDCCSDEEEGKMNVCNMETLNKDKSSLKHMYHMVITGSPGCGKTEVGKILAKLYYTLGIAKKDKFTLAKRSDLIGKYLGHTAKMTQDVFNKAKGGILFIDEAYSLGNPEGRDSFSKECIDTINQNLTENKDTVVFIAGYKEQLEESFFAYNPGLHRRFKFRVEVDKYDAAELRLIYIKKLKDSKWEILNNDSEKSIPLKLFEKNREIFKFNGGDMENLWHQTQIVHSRRVFGKPRDLLRKINEDDVKNAIETYLENDEVKRRSDDIKKYIRETIYV